MKGMHRPGFCLCLLVLTGCASRHAFKLPRHPPDRVVKMEVTAYSDDPISTGWKRSWLRLGRPVYAYGPNKGKPKQVGITASGTKARRGTVAADTRHLPFGTIVHVPGYGWGRVEDRGGAIKGHKLDLFFDTRQQALNWGRQPLQVQVWFPN